MPLSRQMETQFEEVCSGLSHQIRSQTTLPICSVSMVRFDGPRCLSITCRDRIGLLVVTLRPSSNYNDRFDLVDEDWEVYQLNGGMMKDLPLRKAIEFAILILEREVKW
jgi:hypothetical protein